MELEEYLNVTGSIPEASGSLPFGVYDDNSNFISDIKKTSKWIGYRLGAPIEQIEISWYQTFACYEEAVMEYSTHVNNQKAKDVLIQILGTSISGSTDILNTSLPLQSIEFYNKLTDWISTAVGAKGSYNWHQDFVQMQDGVQDYDLKSLINSGSKIEIKEIYHNRISSTIRASYNYSYTGQAEFTEQTALDGGYALEGKYLLLPYHNLILRANAIEMSDKLRKSQYSYEIINNVLRIYPVPNESFPLYIRYRTNFDPVNHDGYIEDSNIINDISKVPTGFHNYTSINDSGKTWIKKYALALAKEMLGMIRSKYNSIPIPNSEVTLNGDALLSQAENEKTALLEELKTMLEESSYSNMLEKQSNIDAAIQTKYNSSPMKIYKY
jgi:hypothetical protein